LPSGTCTRIAELPLDERNLQQILSIAARKKTPSPRVKTQVRQGILSLLNFAHVFRENHLRVLSPLCKTTCPDPQSLDSTPKKLAGLETTESTQPKRPIFLDSFTPFQHTL
jgi:hypothetical protein